MSFNKKSKKCAVFLISSKEHIQFALKCLSSIKDKIDKKDIFIYCNNDEIKVTLFKDYNLIENLEIRGLRCVPVHKDVPNPIVYYKYLTFLDIFDEYENVLYLDVDTIVVGTLDYLFDRKDFFVVKNNFNSKEVCILSKYNKEDLKYLKIDYFNNRKDMVNAGVMVVPKKYRTPYYYESIVEITNRFGERLVYADQSALSLWCLKHNIISTEEYEYNFQMPVYTKFFIPRYKNIMPYFFCDKKILNTLKIVHYSGKIKPNTNRFLKWKLMGKYAKIFYSLFNS